MSLLKIIMEMNSALPAAPPIETFCFLTTETWNSPNDKCRHNDYHMDG